LIKVRFDVPPSRFPKGDKGNKRLYFEYMLLRHSFAQKLKDPKKGLKASLEEHAKYYILILEEMKRRGLKIPKPTGHPIERYARQFSNVVPVKKDMSILGHIQKANAVYLVSHAKEVYDGTKTLWVTKKPYPNMLKKPLYLAGDGKVWGKVILLSITPISLKEFKELRALHRVTEEERKKWWPKAKKFYAYSFRFEKFKEPWTFLGLPKGPQVFFTLTDKMVKKSSGSIHFEFIGTKGDVEFPPKLSSGEPCRADWCKDPVNLKRKHSGLLIDNSILIDGCGLDWKDSKIKPKAVLLTHLHPDHAGALWEGQESSFKEYLIKNRIPIHVWKGSLEVSKPVKPLDRRLRVLKHQSRSKFTIQGHTFRFFPVYHSKIAPCAAVLIDERMLYNPDFLAWKGGNPFKDYKIDLYIGDGSCMKVDIKRPEKVGHMSMVNQVKMCSKERVKHVKFTHVGHLYQTHEEAKETLRIIARSKGYYEDPDKVYIAEDGDYGELLPDGSIKWKGKTIEKKSFYKPNKPYWREFEPEKVADIPSFAFPAKVVMKIDGMRIQINTKEKTLRSEDEGYHKENKFKKIIKELDKLPYDSVFDAEGIMVSEDGEPLHRTSFIGYVNGKDYEPDKEDRCRFMIFDVYRYKGKDVVNLPFQERLEILKKVKDTEHFKVLREGKHYRIVKSKLDLVKAIKWASELPGSEGAMIIWDKKIETATNQNKAWCKLKKYKEIDCLVVDRTHPKHKDTGEEIKTVWNYMIAAGPYEGRCAEIAKKYAPRGKVVIKSESRTLPAMKGFDETKESFLEAQGVIIKGQKVYAYLGRTFNTKITAPVGGIIRVVTPEVNKYPILDKNGKETGCYYYGVFQPRVVEYVHEKNVPDRIEVLDRLASLTLPRGVSKAKTLTHEEYLRIREEGKPLPPEYYKFKPPCNGKCRGVVQRHWPTGKIVEVKKGEVLAREGYIAKAYWWEGNDLVVEFTGPEVKKEFNTDSIILKFRDHIDVRLEKNKELIGFTVHPPIPAGKTSWDVFKERIEEGEKSQVTVKYPHPKSWLTYEGELLFPTLHGGHRLSVAKIKIMDKFTVKYGVQRKNLHEYFLDGNTLKGRFVLRVILSPSTKKPIWIFVRPKNAQYPLNPVEHKDEGYVDLIRNDKLTPYMAESPREE